MSVTQSNSGKIKIVHIITTIGTGGAEAMLLKLISALDRTRFTSTVVVLANSAPLAAKLEAAGATVTTLGSQSVIGQALALARLRSVVRRIKPDILQGWMVHGNFSAQLVGALLGIPVVWSVRHSRLLPSREKLLTRFISWLMKYLSSLPVRIVYNSSDGKLHHEAFGYHASRSVVIPNGFNLAQFSIDEKARVKYRQAMNVPPDTIVIGMIARFHPMKDHTTFLQAASLLRRQRSNLLFVLVGDGCDPTNAALQSAIGQLDLGQNVLLLGERSDVHALANAFDIGALSSVSEGFPNVVGELMACGVPCVATDVGDTKWLIGDTGILVAPNEPVELAEGLGKLIDLGPDSRSQLGRAARARIAETFSIGSIAQRFEALYLESTLRRTSIRT